MIGIREKVETTKAYRQVFTSEAGKLVLKDLMRQFHLLSHRAARTPEERLKIEAERGVVWAIMKKSSIDESLLEEFLFKLQNEQQRELPKLEADESAPVPAKDSNDHPDGIPLNDQNPRMMSAL